MDMALFKNIFVSGRWWYYINLMLCVQLMLVRSCNYGRCYNSLIINYGHFKQKLMLAQHFQGSIVHISNIREYLEFFNNETHFSTDFLLCSFKNISCKNVCVECDVIYSFFLSRFQPCMSKYFTRTIHKI